VIIDGVDEGRSKTTEKAFEAFLDDIVLLCKQATNATFVLLGRTQILEDCWLYLTDKGTPTGLISILPFSLDRAREYIDAFTGGMNLGHKAEYTKARDTILNLLAAAFGDKTTHGSESFLSFIGYPPVLDAIVTLLQEERNYHRILTALQQGLDKINVEINLLYRIVSYILRREKEQKVLPNILEPLIAEIPEQNKAAMRAGVFEAEEQCMRLVSFCLGRQLKLERISEPLINEKYEAQLVSWLQLHPFVSGHHFRNAVFESFALATLITSSDPLGLPLALEYVDSHKQNYHLLYFLEQLAGQGLVPVDCVRVILGSALEFRSTSASIEMHVDGPQAGELVGANLPANIIDTVVEIFMGTEDAPAKTFAFKSDLGNTTLVHLGPRLSSTYVSLPCEVLLAGGQELEFTAPVEVSADKISLRSPALILRQSATKLGDEQVLLEATTMESTVGRIVTNGVPLILAVSDCSGLAYPAIQYAEKKERPPADPALREKYLRLRRILSHFASRGKGTLAKYKDKIEHSRVLGNLGWAILQQLQKDKILTLSGSFYFLQPENVNKHLGVSWVDLRKGRISDKLLQYLRSVD
jgi:hypothetical protein